ncbi:major facilitator superfamily domain-containing protein [Xylariaceae sp. FL0662B]|nr:major facilitator superfamily domain-containing protein [Xylariaceae sp. FL0662B]
MAPERSVEKGEAMQGRTDLDSSVTVQPTEGIMHTNPPTTPPQDEPPDGGLVAWSQVVSAHISNMMSWGYGIGYAVFQLHYRQTMGLPTAQVSWVGSIQLFLYFVVGLGSGRLSDAGYTGLLYGIGAVMGVFGIFMTSLATRYWQILLAQGFCNGIGGGLMFMPGVTNLGTYFKRKRSLAMALQACGTSTGAILFPAIIQYLTPKLGFPWAVRICGFSAMFLCTVGFILIKPRKLQRSPRSIIDWTAFKNTPFAVFAAGSVFIYFSLYTLMLYINSYAHDIIGITEMESVNFVLITNAAAIPARPVFGFLADRYTGPINTYGFNSAALGIVAFGWIGARTRVHMYVYATVTGFVNGASQGVFPGALSSLVTDVTKMGTWIGMVFALCGVSVLAGPPLMGEIIDADGGRYLWAQVWAGLVIIIGSAMVLFTSWLVGWRHRSKLWHKV